MRKIFTILAVAATLLCLTSCMKDKAKNYTFMYDVVGSLQDEVQGERAKEYFEDLFLDRAVSYYGTRFDVMDKALVQFDKDLKEIDNEFVYSLIEYEEDVIQLIGFITDGKNNEWVGTQTWSYDQKQQGEIPIE